MSGLSEKFAELKSRGEGALVLFVTAGDPSLAALPDILAALEEGGADIIELGIPFSDPIADGPIIQASDQRALDSGVTPSAVLKALSAAKPRVPIVLMGYYNPILRMGLASFAARAQAAGASANIVTDLTPEESGPWKDACGIYGLDTVFLAAPTSTDERLDQVCRASTGFVYAVSRTGVTGTAESARDEVAGLVERIRRRTALPVCVGFGITKPEHVRAVAEVADGAVIGSWLVNLLHHEWNGGRGRAEITRKISEMKAATR